jgi:ABC-type multidrug transport system fused ATPase/permease subunit
VGQRQVISFSRTAAKEPQIWLVDEATSHLDPNLDEALMGQLAELANGKTKLIVAHRLQSITNSDLILVLHKGRLIEQGTHAELMKRKGLYSRLYSILFTSQESR